MVKGISRQVILVPSPDPELFDEAIFILKDSAVRKGVTEEMLMRQAKEAIGRRPRGGTRWCILWGLAGAAIIGCIWAITAAL